MGSSKRKESMAERYKLPVLRQVLTLTSTQAGKPAPPLDGNPASHRPGHRPAGILQDVQVDLRVVQAAFSEGVEGVQHQGRHHEIGEEQLGGAGRHEFLAGHGGGIPVLGAAISG